MWSQTWAKIWSFFAPNLLPTPKKTPKCWLILSLNAYVMIYYEVKLNCQHNGVRRSHDHFLLIENDHFWLIKCSYFEPLVLFSQLSSENSDRITSCLMEWWIFWCILCVYTGLIVEKYWLIMRIWFIKKMTARWRFKTLKLF